MKKRFLAVLLACTTIFTLTACTNSAVKEESAKDGSVIEGSAKDGKTGQEAKSEETSKTDGAEPTKITFLTWKRSELGEEKFDGVIDAFHKVHPEVLVEVQDMPYDQVHDKILTLSASGQIPDVVPVNSPWYLEFANAGIIIPIDSYYDKMDDKFKTDIEGPLWTEYNGQHYALPFDSGTIALFYNKQILADAGIEPPATWEELFAASQKVTNPEKGIYAFTGNMQTEPATCITYEVWPYMLQAGAELVSGNQAVFNSKAGIEGLEFYKKLLDAKVMTPGELSAGEEQKRSNFSAGNIAFMIEGPWGVGIQNTANPALEFGVVPMPMGKQAATTASGGCMGISSSSKNPEAAWTFISWLSGEEGQKELAAIGIFPPNKSVLNSDIIQGDEYMKVFAEAYQGIAVNPDLSMPQSDELRKAFTIEVQQFISGNKTAQQALDDAAAVWNEAFKELEK